ncbi:G-box-binding factor-like [Drosophila miranda]|uniref:G-box-binding factor-like n=1 Tax=Drosophila miranda TaxID=7229 RepID=UPI00143F66AF|nr:G-box-binding factor-like [Drosophila miranda]
MDSVCHHSTSPTRYLAAQRHHYHHLQSQNQNQHQHQHLHQKQHQQQLQHRQQQLSDNIATDPRATYHLSSKLAIAGALAGHKDATAAT